MSGCAIPGCTDPCRSGQLMCKWHWRKVPAALKALVNSAWTAVQDRSTVRDRSEDALLARLLVIRTYQDAKEKAVASVCEKEGLRRVG